MLGSSFSIGGIFAKVFCKRFFCAGVKFFTGEAAVAFSEDDLVELFLDKNNHYIDVLTRFI
jgi:hypothetical protein